MNGGRTLVTGAGGFIGSHLCQALVRAGAHVTALCRYTSRRDIGNLRFLAEERDEVRIEFADVRDTDRVAKLVDEVDTVFHLAASISVPYSYVAPREVVATNIEGTLNVLQAALAGDARVVQMSSSEVYGTAQYTPIDERHPLAAQSPYAASKVGADKLAETFHLAFDLETVVARPFNTYGPRQSMRAVIPTIVAQALHEGVIRLGSLAPRRDFVFVGDTVDGLIRLASLPRMDGGVYNLATGADVSVSDVVDQVASVVGQSVQVVEEEVRLRPAKSEVLQLLGDANKMREATGWAPRTSLRDGLEAVVDWLRVSPPGEPSAYSL